MAKSLSVDQKVSSLNQPHNQPQRWMEFAEVEPPAPTMQLQDLDVGDAELAVSPAQCFRLDLEDLECFEAVHRQFERWGIVFSNTIALRPSNPAYPAYSGVMVLMSAPKNGYIEVSFVRPASFVSSFITSSRRTVVTAFDSSGNAIACAETQGANLATSNTEISPNTQLSLKAKNIHRVTFHAFDGQVTLDDFCFCA
jgi:hypothetical protein